MRNVLTQIKKLSADQKQNWILAKENYSLLKKTQSKKLFISDIEIIVQNNPERIKSSSAKVDKKSIEERKCFLCEQNRPQEQNKIDIIGQYQFLINPFPIFENHFTIPHIKHKDQLIKNSFIDSLKILQLINEDFTIFYNGPECGASAPDHLHFQSCGKNILPLEKNYELLKQKCIRQIKFQNSSVNFINDGLRKFISLEFDEINEGEELFLQIYNLLSKIDKSEIEPKLNLVSFKNGKFVCIIIPREKHRPDCFYKDGEEQILISPASVDLGGILICPREEDYKKMDENLIREIFSEVCYSDEKFNNLADSFNRNY